MHTKRVNFGASFSVISALEEDYRQWVKAVRSGKTEGLTVDQFRELPYYAGACALTSKHPDIRDRVLRELNVYAH